MLLTPRELADKKSKPPQEPWLFLGLGAWTSFIVCLMIFQRGHERRSPASQLPAAPKQQPSPPAIRWDYFLSFNSIHREK